MIKIDDLSYKYRDGDTVLSNICLEIQEGEFVSIVGKNGAGKSTLGKLLAGLLKPTKGTIYIDDLDTKKKENFFNIRQKIGIVFQNPENQLIFNNVYDEIAFCLNNLQKDHIEDRIQTSLEMVGMQDHTKRDIFELSLGQKQRIVIAETLSIKPKYILFDEPTTMLDSKGKEDIYKILKSLHQQGYTIIYITNILEEVLLSDRVIVIDQCEIVKEIKKEDYIDAISILEEYGVKTPKIVELVMELRKRGFSIHTKNFEIKEIVEQIVGGMT